MKIYNIEPTYKKSVCEVELWRKNEDVVGSDSTTCRYNWNGPILRRECWWRWAEWRLEIPDTQEEIQEFLEHKPFDSLDQYLDHRGYDTLKECLLPDNFDDDDSVHCLEDDFEMMYCWDGQGEEFRIQPTRNLEMSEEEQKHLAAEAERMYSDEGMYEEGLEELGWEHYSTFYEVCCSLDVTLEETEEEKLQRLFTEFQTKFRNDLESSPQTLGNIFEKHDRDEAVKDDDDNDVHDNILTRYDFAVNQFGKEKIFKELMDVIPATINCAFEGEVTSTYPSFMVAASLPNVDISIIFQLLRENPNLCY